MKTITVDIRGKQEDIIKLQKIFNNHVNEYLDSEEEPVEILWYVNDDKWASQENGA